MKHQVLKLIPEKLGSILLKTLRGPAAKAGNSSAVTRNQSNIGFRFFKCAKQDFRVLMDHTLVDGMPRLLLVLEPQLAIL